MVKPPFKIMKFDKALHDRSAFTCGVIPIDNWFKRSISKQITDNRIRVWCATNEENELVGFYAICTHSVLPSNLPDVARKNERHDIPVVYITAIATATHIQRQGLGSALMGNAVETAVELSETIGISAIILDIFKDEHFEKRKSFYERIGFKLVGSDKARMYLSINDAKASQEAL